MAVTVQIVGTGTTPNVEVVPNSTIDPSDLLYLHPSYNPGAMLVSTNGATLYQIQKKINDLSQGTLGITTYYTQLKKLWEELSTLSAKTQCNCQCTCGAKENMHKAEQNRRLIQFLMGLNEVYTTVRGSILMMNSLPLMAQAFSLLIQDENQREMKPTNHLSAESVSLHVNISGNANNFGNNNFRTNYSPNANFPNTNKTRPFYYYCKRLGHTKDKCFKLHGYPQVHNQNFKYNKNKRVIANAHVTSPDETCPKIDEFGPKDESQNLNLSKEQYSQLLRAMPFAGMITCTSSIDFEKLSCKCFRTLIDTWILDSRASHHMTFNRSSLLDIRTLPYPLLVTLPNGYKSLVAFTDACYLLHAPSTNRPLEIGKIRDGLSICNKSSLCDKDLSQCDQLSSVHKPILNKTSVCAPFSCLSHGNDVNVLWHNRLGYVPFVKMKSIYTIPVAFSNKQPFLCSICPMARQTRLPFPQRTSNTKQIFDLLHIDIWGPYHTPTHNNYKYFLTMVDDYSRTTWTHLLSSKSNALQVLKAFVSLVKNQFHTTIKSVTSDNGLEFTSMESASFFQDQGIVPQKTCPYTPQQNDVVERKHIYLLEIARALLFQSKLHVRYWGKCILTATYLINRLPTSYLKNKYPFKLLYKTKPNYSHIRSFDCLCFPTIPKAHRDKFKPRTVPHVFIGYPFDNKGYKMLDLESKRIHVSRDVTFHENIFPFAISPTTGSFPSTIHSISFITKLHTDALQPTTSIPSNSDNVEATSDESTLNHSADSFLEPQPSNIPIITSHDLPDNTSQDPPPTLEPRRFGRQHKIPTHLQDYVYTTPQLKSTPPSVTKDQ
ncbi:uncharacterized protein LOC142170460 [Nicotiana tabacum]|uniref:Uncharacterized protein LOC142170460 n=1 Tax=Nicotiana tabacum TaxID=4097 RepID=A0AC58SU18_TOBAC